MLLNLCPNPSITPNPPQDQVFTTPKPLSISVYQPSSKKLKPLRVSASSSLLNDTDETKEKLRVLVKPMEKPRLVLKFIWMEKNIGIAIDLVIAGYGSVPLNPYYFWPRKDAWEELKVLLESKPWISSAQMVVLLNQATDIINLWQKSGGGLD